MFLFILLIVKFRGYGICLTLEVRLLTLKHKALHFTMTSFQTRNKKIRLKFIFSALQNEKDIDI